MVGNTSVTWFRTILSKIAFKNSIVERAQIWRCETPYSAGSQTGRVDERGPVPHELQLTEIR